jgi:hypothetical protein
MLSSDAQLSQLNSFDVFAWMNMPIPHQRLISDWHDETVDLPTLAIFSND